MAFGFLSLAWGISLVVCSPPWFIREWGIFTTDGAKKSPNSTFTCVYSPSVPYRIYSASGSFYIPLLVRIPFAFIWNYYFIKFQSLLILVDNALDVFQNFPSGIRKGKTHATEPRDLQIKQENRQTAKKEFIKEHESQQVCYF